MTYSAQHINAKLFTSLVKWLCLMRLLLAWGYQGPARLRTVERGGSVRNRPSSRCCPDACRPGCRGDHIASSEYYPAFQSCFAMQESIYILLQPLLYTATSQGSEIACLTFLVDQVFSQCTVLYMQKHSNFMHFGVALFCKSWHWLKDYKHNCTEPRLHNVFQLICRTAA